VLRDHPDREESLTDARRLQRKIDKQRETEARWLQKMLFALSKAKEAREKLADATGEELNPLITLDDGTKVSLDALEEIVDKRVGDLMTALGQGVYGKR
jgi:phage shock protein A